MAYKLAPHVTEEMLMEMGFEIQGRVSRLYPRCALKDEIYIPLEESDYGNRVIQDENYGTDPEDFDPERIQDLIEKGMVIEC